MSFDKPSKFINLLTTDKRLNNDEFTLKRKVDCLNNEEDEIEDTEFNTLNKINPNKYLKHDIILSSYNIKSYDNPLLVNDPDKINRIERKLSLLHKNNYIHFANYKRLNDNIKVMFRNNSKQYNDINTKIDLLNTKINTITSKIENIDQEYVDITHKLCVKIDKLEKNLDKFKKEFKK